jgi:hypothetical protein
MYTPHDGINIDSCKTKAPNLGPNDRNVKLENVLQNPYTDNNNSIEGLQDIAPGLS